MFKKKITKFVCACLIAVTALGAIGYITLSVSEDTTPVSRILINR